MKLTKAELAKHVGRRVSFIRNGIQHEGQLVTIGTDLGAGQRGLATVELDDLTRPLVHWTEITPLEELTPPASDAILCGPGRATERDLAVVAEFSAFLRAQAAVTGELVELVAKTRHHLTNQGYFAMAPRDPTPWDQLDEQRRALARHDTRALLLAAHVAGVWPGNDPRPAGN